MTRVTFIALLVIGLFTFSPAILRADQQSPFVGTVTDEADFNNSINDSIAEKSAVTVINQIDPVSTTVRFKTIGNVTFVFNREWHVPAASYADNGFATLKLESRGMHLQGFAIVRSTNAKGKRKKKRVPVAATVFNITSSKPTIEAEFFADAHGDGGNYYQVKGALEGKALKKLVRVKRVSKFAHGAKTCGLSAAGQKLNHEASHRSAKLSVQPVTTNALKSFDIATEADYEWFARYGSNSNTKIQSILNGVQTIYQNQLNLSLNLTRQVVVSTSGTRYTSSNVETLLNSFRTYTEANEQLGSADVFHLFTGKDTFLLEDGNVQNPSVIGLAYLGVVCAFPSYSYGLTEDLDDALNHVTTAHELGHNFSAEHDAAGSIMGTVLNLSNPPMQFSTNSKNVIANHVSENSDCLSDGGDSPTPTPTTPSGGSGNTPGQGDTSHVQLTTSITSKGLVNIQTTFSEIDSSCTTELRASSRSGKVYNGQGTLIATIDPNSTTTTYTKVPVKRKGAGRIYFGVTKSCSGTTYYSMTKSINTKNVNSTKAALTASSWIKLLKSKVAAASPVLN